jgi:hypothetical protein
VPPPPPRLRRLGPWLAALATLALPSARVAADDVNGRAALSWLQNDDSGGARSSEFRQLYDLRVQRLFTDTLGYSLGLTFQGEDGRTELLDLGSRLATRTVRPIVGLKFKDGPWLAAVSYDYTASWTFDPLTRGWPKRDLQTGSFILQYLPSEALRANISADVYTARSDGTSPTTSNRLSTLVDWSPVKPLRLTETNQLLTFESGAGAVRRLSYGPQLQVQYDELFWKSVAVSARTVSQYLRSEDRLRLAASGSVEVDEFPLLAFSGHNELPTEPPAVPPTQNPALIDRDFTASTGVDLGPAGASFWNLSVDMGRVLALDLFRIHVRDRTGALVPSGGLVSWSVYSSTDGQRWVELLGSTFVFDPNQSLFAVSFPRTSARYFKVVSFGTNLIDTLVTELQVSALTDVGGEQRRVSETFRQSLQGSLSAKAGEKVMLSYQGLLNLSYSGQEGLPGAWGRDSSHSASATLGPYSDFTFLGSVSRRDARPSPSTSQDSTAASVQARYEPIPRFQASAGLALSTDQANGVRGTNRSAQLESRLRLWEAIRLMANTSLSRQLVSGVASDFVGVSSQADVDVTRSLALRANAQLSHQVSANAALSPVGLPIPVTVQYGLFFAELRYRSGEALMVAARVGYTESRAGSGVNQNYTAEWNPLPGGAIQLALNAEQTIDPLLGRRFQRVTLWPRWVINWYAVLDLNYNLTVEKAVTGSRRQEQLMLTLTLTY